MNVKAGVSYVWSTRPELWIGSYEFFYRTRSQRPTWNPWNEDGTPAAGFGTGDGNPAYYRDKLTQKNSTTRATYNIGFTLDILPKQLVLNGNASLLNYDYQRENSIKLIRPRPLLHRKQPVRQKRGCKNISRFN